jgi:HD superfamily phosphohydrolase YqeK
MLRKKKEKNEKFKKILKGKRYKHGLGSENLGKTFAANCKCCYPLPTCTGHILTSLSKGF